MLLQKSRLGRAAVVACAMFAFGGLLSTTAAQASSIVYSQNNNIWIANPDGTGQYQATLDGTAGSLYSSPSEDNNGIIAAAHDGQLVRMRQNGQVLSSFTPPSENYIEAYLYNPLSPVISTDGMKIAYYYVGYSCDVSAGCGSRELTEVSDSSQPNLYAKVYGRHTPVWLTGSRLMIFDGYQDTIDLFDIGTSSPQAWLPCDPDCNSSSQADDWGGVLSPQHDKLVMVRVHSDGTTHLAFSTVSGDPTSRSAPAQPGLVCETTVDDPTLSTPSFSPDGSQLIYSDSQGVWLVNIPATLNSNGSNCGSITFSSSPIIPGGSQARFGLPNNNPPPRGGPGGQRTCHVPNLIGKTLAAARTALSRANCTLGKVTKRHTTRKKRGHVLSESPSAGASRSVGAKVNLVVGK